MSSTAENGKADHNSDTREESISESRDSKNTDASLRPSWTAKTLAGRNTSGHLPDDSILRPPKRMQRKKTFLKDFLAEALPLESDVVESKNVEILSDEERRYSLAAVETELLHYFENKNSGLFLKGTPRQSGEENSPSTSHVREALQESTGNSSNVLDEPEEKEDQKEGPSGISKLEDISDNIKSQKQKSNRKSDETMEVADETNETTRSSQTPRNKHDGRTSWVHRSGFVGKEPLDHRRKQSWIGPEDISEKVRRGRRRTKLFGISDPATGKGVGADELNFERPTSYELYESALGEIDQDGDPTPFSYYVQKDTLWPEEFEQQFSSFALVNEPHNNGKNISLSNTDKWLEKADILNHKTITPIDTGLCFLGASDNRRNGKTLTFEQFIRFLKMLGQMKKIPLEDLINKMTFCGPPLIYAVDEELLQIQYPYVKAKLATKDL